ncbi:MAG: hypothetical protein KAR38_01550, partial [Calditrichia bacterium]|nr:hypothetical protein [Calditrichia bacterium]
MKITNLYKKKSRMKFWMIFIPLIFLFLSGMLPAQNGHVPSDNRGDANTRRNSNMNGNNVRATVHNFGWSGWLNNQGDQWAYEWPKNTGRIHVALVAIWLGGEVKDENGETIQVVEFPALRTNNQGDSWNLEPVPGFLNPDQDEIARSDIEESWPQSGTWGVGWRDKMDDPADPGWVGSWNGFFGKNVFNADQEMFYRCSDDNYNKHNYFPDTTDYSRAGLGFLMDVRSLAWSQILVNDVIFYIHDIKNDGTKRVNKTSFLIWLADIVGGDANDDEPFVDLQNNIAFLTDADRIGGEAWDGEA